MPESTCPRCHARVHIRRELVAGELLACPQCKGKVRVVARTPDPPIVVPIVEELPVEEVLEAKPLSPRRRRITFRERVQVSARILHWPAACACCLGRHETFHLAKFSRTTGKKVVKTDTRAWEIPYCSRCLWHVRIRRFGIGLLVACLLLGAVSSLSVSSWLYFFPWLLIGIALLVPFVFWAQRYETPDCSSHGSYAVIYRGWEGSVHTLDFSNDEYAERFRRENRSKTLG